jgi:hypothetical protein
MEVSFCVKSQEMDGCAGTDAGVEWVLAMIGTSIVAVVRCPVVLMALPGTASVTWGGIARDLTATPQRSRQGRRRSPGGARERGSSRARP